MKPVCSRCSFLRFFFEFLLGGVLKPVFLGGVLSFYLCLYRRVSPGQAAGALGVLRPGDLHGGGLSRLHHGGLGRLGESLAGDEGRGRGGLVCWGSTGLKDMRFVFEVCSGERNFSF